MPHKHEKLNIPTPVKRSAKLTKDEKEDIRKEYLVGGIPQNELARKYGVSKRLIQFCIYPEKQKTKL